MVLFGLQGSGVSSTANTIIGDVKFKTGLSFEQITTCCQTENCEIFGRQVQIIDTPGFPNKINVENVKNAFSSLKQGFGMLMQGCNVFLLILPIDRYTDASKLMVECLEQVDDIKRHAIVIFTGLDRVEEPKEITRQKIKTSETLRDLLQFVSGRFVLFNNTIKDENQMHNLLRMADEVVSKNANCVIDSGIFNERTAVQIKTVVVGSWTDFFLNYLVYIKNGITHTCNIS